MGAVRWMARNHVASNLLMMVFIVGGLVMGLSIKQEVFPEISLDMVQVSVAYPGAGPEEVEEGIILKIEENISGVNGIKEIKSVANEGFGSVTAEVMQGEDVARLVFHIQYALSMALVTATVLACFSRRASTCSRVSVGSRAVMTCQPR